VAFEFLQYGATLGCANVPAPALPTGGIAVGVGNEPVPAAPGAPGVTQTYACIYRDGQPPTCQVQTLGVPALFSVGIGSS